MSKENTKKDLLNEELKRFKMISEFRFHEDRPNDEDLKGQEIILGNSLEEDEEVDIDSETEDIESELGLDGENSEEGDVEPEGEMEPEEDESIEGLDAGEPIDDMEMEPESDEVELDVTEIVKGTEEAKMSADMANQKLGQLMGMIDNLEKQVSSMTDISSKIDNLENELEKRVPTEDEKLDLRSLDSAPYNMKLTDFWSDQEGQYDVLNKGSEPEEYILNRSDVDSDYSESSIKDSFNENPYEEEDII